MLGTLARGTYVVVMAAMFAAWAISYNKEPPATVEPPPSDQVWQIYS